MKFKMHTSPTTNFHTFSSKAEKKKKKSQVKKTEKREELKNQNF